MYRFFIVSLFVLFSVTKITAQMPDTFGKITDFEKNLSSYDKDPSASAVVLYERGDNYFKVVRNKLFLVKHLHKKIKIFNENSYDEGTIKIPFYGIEKIENLNAITHNAENKYEVNPSQIHTTKKSQFESVKTFTFPNLKKGSVIEYKFDIITPYYVKLNGWNFQGKFPKLRSEFSAKIPGFLKYNRTLRGSLKLENNDASVEKHCFKSTYVRSSCEVLKYTMNDIPAMKTDSEYMLSYSNYISRLEFELAQIKYNNLNDYKISTTWEEVDEDFMKTEGIGPQLLKKGFFRRKVPDSLFIGGDKLSKAKKIFKFVQGHYNWNETYGSFSYNNVKEAFNEKVGNAAEINMTLVNLLNEVGIRTNLMLLSTRQNSLPKKSHPVMYDFNYFIARMSLDGKIYFLDATDRHMPFGVLPVRALNHYGRVMDFERESYWANIIPEKNNTYQVRGQVTFDPTEQNTEGVLDIYNSGYFAVKKRKLIEEKTEEGYLNGFECNLSEDFVITDYELAKERSDQKKVSERLKFQLEDALQSEKVYFNPFLIQFFESNPFKLEKRDYPIDFGYPQTYRYQVNINVPVGYKVSELPESMEISLGQSIVDLKFHVRHNETQVSVALSLALRHTHFKPDDYDAIKQIFGKVIELQKNSLIVLEKMESK